LLKNGNLPFDKLTVLSKVEGLKALSKAEGLRFPDFRRCGVPKYASLLMISGALHLILFENLENTTFSRG